MNKHQRISTAKYLYDISKGIALLSIVGNIVQGKWVMLHLATGFVSTLIFFIFAYILERGISND